MTSQDNIHEIDIEILRTVCGGQLAGFPLPLQVPQVPALPAPTKPTPTTHAVPTSPATPTFTHPTTMAPPKYSAGWWDIVRRMGLSK